MANAVQSPDTLASPRPSGMKRSLVLLAGAVALGLSLYVGVQIGATNTEQVLASRPAISRLQEQALFNTPNKTAQALILAQPASSIIAKQITMGSFSQLYIEHPDGIEGEEVVTTAINVTARTGSPVPASIPRSDDYDMGLMIETVEGESGWTETRAVQLSTDQYQANFETRLSSRTPGVWEFDNSWDEDTMAKLTSSNQRIQRREDGTYWITVPENFPVDSIPLVDVYMSDAINGGRVVQGGWVISWMYSPYNQDGVVLVQREHPEPASQQ